MLKTRSNAFHYSGTKNNKKAKNGSVFGTLTGLVEDTVTAATKAVKNSFSLPDSEPSGKKHKSDSDAVSVVSSAKTAAERQGRAIKSIIKNALSKKYGELDTRHLFDDIDDKDVENNISTAENTIKSNVDRGFLSKDYYKKFPNLKNGLALSYAAANKGNNKEAKKAREAAYFENAKEAGTKLLYENRPTFDSFKRLDEKPSNIRFFAKVQNNTFQQGKAGKRYVNVKSGNLYMRSAPGTDNAVLNKMAKGTEVNFTGNKTAVGDRQWAEVEYGGQKGWVDAGYLKIEAPEDLTKKQHFFPAQKQNPLDAKQIQDSFNQYTDFDNSGSLQCPDFVKWYIDKYTFLNWSRGNGNEQVANTIDKNNLDKNSIIKDPNSVTFPALYSVEGNKALLGASGSAPEGHTGIILGKSKTSDGQDAFVVLHTWKGCNVNGYNSSIGTYVIPEDHVTYLNLSPYLI